MSGPHEDNRSAGPVLEDLCPALQERVGALRQKVQDAKATSNQLIVEYHILRFDLEAESYNIQDFVDFEQIFSDHKTLGRYTRALSNINHLQASPWKLEFQELVTQFGISIINVRVFQNLVWFCKQATDAACHGHKPVSKLDALRAISSAQQHRKASARRKRNQEPIEIKPGDIDTAMVNLGFTKDPPPRALRKKPSRTNKSKAVNIDKPTAELEESTEVESSIGPKSTTIELKSTAEAESPTQIGGGTVIYKTASVHEGTVGGVRQQGYNADPSPRLLGASASSHADDDDGDDDIDEDNHEDNEEEEEDDDDDDDEDDDDEDDEDDEDDGEIPLPSFGKLTFVTSRKRKRKVACPDKGQRYKRLRRTALSPIVEMSERSSSPDKPTERRLDESIVSSPEIGRHGTETPLIDEPSFIQRALSDELASPRTPVYDEAPFHRSPLDDETSPTRPTVSPIHEYPSPDLSRSSSAEYADCAVHDDDEVESEENDDHDLSGEYDDFQLMSPANMDITPEPPLEPLGCVERTLASRISNLQDPLREGSILKTPQSNLSVHVSDTAKISSQGDCGGVVSRESRSTEKPAPIISPDVSDLAASPDFVSEAHYSIAADKLSASDTAMSTLEYSSRFASGEWLNQDCIHGILNKVRLPGQKCVDLGELDGHKDWAMWAAARPTHASTHEYEQLFVPCCLQDHWFLLVFDCQLQTIEYYNSVRKLDRNDAPAMARAMLKVFGLSTQPAGKWKLISRNDAPQQANHSDCGIHVIMSALCVMAKLPIPTDYDTNLWRLLLPCLLEPSTESRQLLESGCKQSDVDSLYEAKRFVSTLLTIHLEAASTMHDREKHLREKQTSQEKARDLFCQHLSSSNVTDDIAVRAIDDSIATNKKALKHLLDGRTQQEAAVEALVAFSRVISDLISKFREQSHQAWADHHTTVIL